jgi:hypothetical protein
MWIGSTWEAIASKELVNSLYRAFQELARGLGDRNISPDSQVTPESEQVVDYESEAWFSP